MSRQPTLERAAEILREYADLLDESERFRSGPNEGQLPPEIQEDVDEYRSLAGALEAAPSSASTSTPKAVGVSRVADSEHPEQAAKALLVSFERRPTDDELRAIHELLAGRASRSALSEMTLSELWKLLTGLTAEIHKRQIALEQGRPVQ